MCGDLQDSGKLCSPDNVEEHLVAGRTLKTACGEQCTMRTSSGVNAWDGWERTSSLIDFVIVRRVAAVGVSEATSDGRTTWKANGTGSSSFKQPMQAEVSHDLTLYSEAKRRTWVFSLFTSTSNPSLEMSAGRLTAGARACPSSSDTNWTMMFGVGLGGSGSGSGTP